MTLPKGISRHHRLKWYDWTVWFAKKRVFRIRNILEISVDLWRVFENLETT